MNRGFKIGALVGISCILGYQTYRISGILKQEFIEMNERLDSSIKREINANICKTCWEKPIPVPGSGGIFPEEPNPINRADYIHKEIRKAEREETQKFFEKVYRKITYS